ncbi:MAG: DUF1028 domain-containing protein [Phycisphaerales bacterium]
MPAVSRLFDRSLSAFSRRPASILAASIAMASGSAQATWSILIADTRTGEIVIGSATCVEAIDLQRSTPVLISGVGHATAQSDVDIFGENRQLIRDRLLQGVPLGAILDELAATDPGHSNRQYGMITAGGQTLTYSGTENADWAGGIRGRIEMGRLGTEDDIVYTVQGNILSGENVVQAAVDAIINTDSDLPGRIMAAMQAARVAGGDGRCSCSIGNPTGCGSPPPEPFKSAHVGYMLGTRADDIDASQGVYPITNDVGGLALADVDGDGMKDVLVGDALNDEITVFLNTALPGDPLSHVIRGQTINAGASATAAMAAGDFDADGLDDVAIALTDPPTLALLFGQPGGGLEDPQLHPLPAVPTGIAAGQLIGDDGAELAVSQGSLELVQPYTFGGPDNREPMAFGQFSVDGTPGRLSIGDVELGDGLNDLIVPLPGADRVHIAINAKSQPFAASVMIDTAAEPVQTAAADMDLDGDIEIVVLSDAGRKAQVFDRDGGSWTLAGEANTIRDGNAMAVGPFNPGDDYPDIVTISAFNNRNMQVFLSDGAGGYDFDDRIRVGFSASNILLHDMNASGDTDIIIGNSGRDGLILVDNPQTHDLPQPDWYAAGDYFLAINIANQRDDDPDPVDQMQTAFDDWRATLAGRVDAVQSSVTGRSRVAPGQSVTLTIQLRDWQGNLLNITDPSQIEIDGGDGLVMVSGPVPIEPGVFEATIEGVSPDSTGGLIVRAGEPGDRVQLMPGFEVFVVGNPADLNADGVCNFFDIALFIGLFTTQSPDADFFNDTIINFYDLSAFFQSFDACRDG